MLKTKRVFKTSICVSRKWDGKEVADELIEKVEKGVRNPKFILLFTTIHYKKEFKKILSSLKKTFPISPLIGGTVAGFMTPEGCYTRGVVMLMVEYPNMDVAIGVGHNTKKNPKKAGRDAAHMIIKGLKDSKWDNKFLFQMVSGPTTPHFSRIGKGFIIKGKISSSIAIKLIEISTKKIEMGIGREDEVLENISSFLKDYLIISGSSSDDMKVMNNFQFFNDKVLNNSIVGIAISIDRKMEVKYNHGFHKFSKEKFKITKKSFGGKIIEKLNGKSAVNKFIETINWPNDLLDERLHQKTFFFPLGFEYKDKTLAPAAIGAILGSSISFSYSIKSKYLYILSASGKSIVNSINKCINKNAKLIFGISCCANLATLGDDIYLIQRKLKNFKDFLIIFTLGEGVYIPKERESKFFNEAHVILSIL